jgi:hypothetical protein
VATHGVGDAVVIGKIMVSRLAVSGNEIQVGAGPKIPFGRTNFTDSRGITLNADLQPGSGSWDLITWGFFMRQLKARPTVTWSARFVGRINGTNRSYLGSESYQFGKTFQFYLGMGDQFLLGKNIVTLSLTARYRHAFPDRINDHLLDNTGGSWVNLIPAVGFSVGPNTLIQLVPEIPVKSRVVGIQLTPTFRIQTGIYHTFGNIKTEESNTFQL